MLSIDKFTLMKSKHLSFRQKASWLMLGCMPIVAMCIVITIIFRFTRPKATERDIYSWIPLCIHFILARYTALYSPGAGHVTPLYLAWRDSTAFFTYFSVHLFTLWTAVTRTKAKFVTTGKESNDAEAGRWHPLCWWNVMLSVATGTLLVWLTDASVCDSLTTFGAFIITVYIFISNWDVMSVILNPMTRWPLDPYANNISIVVEPYVSRGDTLPMFNSSALHSSNTVTAQPSAQPSALSSPTAAAAAAAAAAKHTAVQQQQQQMAPVATVTTSAAAPAAVLAVTQATTASTLTATAAAVAAAVAAVTLPTTTSTTASTAAAAAAVTPPTAVPAVRRNNKSFMRWYAGARGVFILMIVTSHIQIGLSNSGIKKNEDQWGTWIGLPTWLSAIIWPLGASHSGAHIGIRALTFCTGYGLSMSCSRRDVSFSTMKEYTGFVKTRLHR
jgi:hypothetical protein